MILYGYVGQLLMGLGVTLSVSCCAVLLGLILGIAAASCELSAMSIVRQISHGITSLLRGLPELLILFAVYFGGAVILSKLFGRYTEINAFCSGVLALALIFAAYASQVFRGAFLAIARGQKEAAAALGLSSWQCFSKIILPQAWRYALPGLSNLWLSTLKDSSLVSIIGLADLTYHTQIAANATFKPFTFYAICALCYLVLTTCSELFFNYFNKSIKHHGY